VRLGGLSNEEALTLQLLRELRAANPEGTAQRDNIEAAIGSRA
jgi:hypothetical protein